LTSVEAGAAGLAASSPSVPLGHGTVDWTLEVVAALILLKVWTRNTVVVLLDQHSTRAGLDTTADTAGDGALAELGPFADNAVNWARPLLASLGLLKSWALDTTVGNISLNRARAGLDTTTAGHGASVVRAPLTDNAVNWASPLLAGLGLLKIWALDTTVGNISLDRARAGLDTTVAAHGASVVRAPLTDNAVDWASPLLASLGLLKIWAWSTVGSVDASHLTRASLDTAVAGSSASIVLGPLANETVVEIWWAWSVTAAAKAANIWWWYLSAGSLTVEVDVAVVRVGVECRRVQGGSWRTGTTLDIAEKQTNRVPLSSRVHGTQGATEAGWKSSIRADCVAV